MLALPIPYPDTYSYPYDLGPMTYDLGPMTYDL